MTWGSWGVDVYLGLRERGLIAMTERGAMPLPDEVATAFAADGLIKPAADIRAGTPDGRDAFEHALLAVIAVKRGEAPVDGWLRHLPADVLAPFAAPAVREPCPEHARTWTEFLETRENLDPELRR